MSNLNDLYKIIKKHWPIKRAVVECKVCSEELFDTEEKNTDSLDSSSLAGYINMVAESHQVQTGHSNVAVDIDPTVIPVKDVNVEITVNG